MLDGSKSRLRVELINVGHGDALLLHWIPEQGVPATILVDGGPKAGGQRVKATLDKLGASAVDLAVLTHCDADHVDGLLAYAQLDDRVVIHRYWGPCVPAFERHSWLFPPRIRRGLDQTLALQAALGAGCRQSWPVEGAVWTSTDGGLTIRVLSPAGRVIERLLLGHESVLSLFLDQPMPLGWLLTDAADTLTAEDPFADLRFSISKGEITPDRIPDNLPPAWRPSASVKEIAKSAKAQGIDPEFFGNSVLNDTSIVLLVEARMGPIQRRLLLTGDLENFTYLMARWPMGLGCEVVKAPHHGSYSYVDREKAYDAVWQWLRPRAALVSANGKHKLPRTDFRDAALRYGATLFCTSRRTREIVSGPTNESCCHSQFGCGRVSQQPVSLSITSTGIDSDGIACARGNLSGAMPVIEIRQHLVEPSPILATLAENEIRRHVDWAVKWLRRTMQERQGRQARADLEPVPMDSLRKAAVAEGRFAAAAEMETILERATREGKVWLSRSNHYRHDDRKVWTMPDSGELAALKEWIDQYYVVQLAVKQAKVASGVTELLYAADTEWLADRMAEHLFFPRAMFDDVLWPILVAHLLKTRSVGVRDLLASQEDTYISGPINTHGAETILVLFSGENITAAAEELRRVIDPLASDESIQRYLKSSLEQLSGTSSYESLVWPQAVEEMVSPLWLGKVLPPSGLIRQRWVQVSPLVGLEESERAAIEHWVQQGLSSHGNYLPPWEHVSIALPTLILSGFDIVSLPAARLRPWAV
jgi:hypothetical protein